MILEAIEIKEHRLPAEEVIALDMNGHAIVGILSKVSNGTFICESEDWAIKNVTHYITIPKK